jgi:hypothetical protein
MLRRFWFGDAILILIPGALCVWGAAATATSNQSDVRRTFPAMFLAAFLLYVGSYVGARLLIPWSARLMTLTWLLPAAMLMFLAGGISLGAGYQIFAFIVAPMWGASLGVLAMRESTAREQSPAVDA